MIDEPKKVEIDYSLSFLKKPTHWGILVFIFFFTIIINFPFSRTLDSGISKAFTVSPTCPIEFESFGLNFLGLEFKNVKIPSSCTGGKPLNLEKINLGLTGMSFSPFGPSFNLKTNIANIPIDADLAVGVGGFVLLIENDFSGGKFEKPLQKINLSQLSDFIPISLNGDIFISNFHFKSDFNLAEIDILTVNIVSQNLIIPKQLIRIPNFPAPFNLEKSLVIKDLLLLGQLETSDSKPLFKLERFTLGDDTSPLRTEFKGKINLNPKRMDTSVIDLSGELKLADDFPQKDLLGLFLGRFDQRDEFYQIQLRGPINNKDTFLLAKSPRK